MSQNTTYLLGHPDSSATPNRTKWESRIFSPNGSTSMPCFETASCLTSSPKEAGRYGMSTLHCTVCIGVYHQDQFVKTPANCDGVHSPLTFNEVEPGTPVPNRVLADHLSLSQTSNTYFRAYFRRMIRPSCEPLDGYGSQ